MYRDINLFKSFTVKNMRCCRKDNLLHVNVTRDGPNYARFYKHNFFKNLEFNTYA